MQTMKNTVAIVDYGMGNLRSVWQAVQAAAADSSVQVQVTHDPARGACGQPRGAAGPRGHARLHGRPAPQRPGRSRAPGRGQQTAVWRVRRHANAAGAQRRGRHPRAGTRSPARCAALTWPTSAKPTAAASKCRKWAGTRCGKPGTAANTIPCGRAWPMAAFSTLYTATTPSPRGPTMARQQQSTA